MSTPSSGGDVLLRGRTALVTGGSRGVGAAISRLLGARGANVLVNYRDKQRRANQVAEEVAAAGGAGATVQADVTSTADINRMVQEAKERFGTLDLLILNASGGLERDVPSDYAMRLNRDAQVELARRMLPVMVPGGRIVFVTSHLAHFHGSQPVLPEYEPVAASKKAGETALRDMIPEFEERGVSLVLVSGDLIDGTITPKLLDRMRPGMIEQRRSEVGWLPTTDDFARAIVDAAVSPDLATGDTVYVGAIG